MAELVHAIWLGDKMPPLSHACLDDWRKMGFSYRLWTDSDEQVQAWINGCSFARECYERRLYAFVSDYLRLKVLEREGGLYLDTDVTIRQNPFPLFAGLKFAMGFETDDYLGTAAIFSQPDSAILAELIRFYEGGIWSSPLYIGPQVATHLINGATLPETESYALFPVNYFYPYRQEPIDFRCPDESYLVHWFQHSWKQSPGIAFLKSKHLGFWGKFYTWQKYFFRGLFRG